MTASRRSRTPRLMAAALATLMLLPSIPAQSSLTKDTKDRILGRMGQIITSYAYVPGVDFSKWNEFIEKQRPDIDKAGSDETFRDAVNGALAQFGFSHIALQTPQASKMRRDGQTVGIGVTLQRLEAEKAFMVIRVVPKSPAEEAKLQPGDMLVMANGKPIESQADLLGKEGEPVTLTIKKEAGDERTVKITRRKFSTVRPEELEWVDADTAILRVHTFDLSYDPERVESLMKEAAKSKELIVDLRNNGGGVVLNVQHFLGLFLPANTAAGTFISKRLVERYVTEASGKADDLAGIAAWSKDKVKVLRNEVAPYKGKLAVLVNGWTGSGAEIAAATLREELGSPVIGTKSAGAVLVALIVPLPEGYTLLYPIQDYVTNKGLRLEGNGVEPDIVANDPKVPIPGRPDEVVDKAVAALTSPNQIRVDAAKAGVKSGA